MIGLNGVNIDFVIILLMEKLELGENWKIIIWFVFKNWWIFCIIVLKIVGRFKDWWICWVIFFNNDLWWFCL